MITIRNFYKIQIIVILLLLIYFTYIKRTKQRLEHLEHNLLNEEFKRYLTQLPDHYKLKLTNIDLELTDTLIGYCKNKQKIGVYRSKGNKYKIPQKDVIIHECAHVVNDSTEHDDSFWNHYRELKKYGTDYFHLF